MNPLWIVTAVALLLIAIIAVRFAFVFHEVVDTFEKQRSVSPLTLEAEALRAHRANTLKKAAYLRRSLGSSWRREPN